MLTVAHVRSGWQPGARYQREAGVATENLYEDTTEVSFMGASFLESQVPASDLTKPSS